ncbi:retrovirus-related pol polyprotein from transposon TNT 1-94 [Tanacetum coccineum]
MAWRHHDSSVADPFPGPSEYNALDVAKLREVVISLRRPPLSVLYVVGLSNIWKDVGRAFSLKDSEGKVITMAEFLRLPNSKGCKVSVGALLSPGAARVTHLASPAERLEDVPSKTGDMMMAEISCRKVLDDKENKKRKAVEKAAAKGGQGNVDASFALEGHGDNEGGLSGLQTRPSPAHHSGRHLDTVEEPAYENVVSEVETSYSTGRFGNLPFTPQWGLTDSSRMDNSRVCRDMMLNLFTPADEEFFNEGVRDESAIKRSWKLLCQSVQQQANTLLRFEALKEQHTDLVYAHESCKDVKAPYKECKKELAAVQSAYDEKVSAYDQLSKNYDGALTREKSLQDRLEELEEEKKEADQLNSSRTNQIKQLEEALKAILKPDAQCQLRVEKGSLWAVEAGNANDEYEKLFDRRSHSFAESSDTPTASIA